MNDILKKWMINAETFEIQKSYGVEEIQEYDFVRRQGDFYITLLNRMYTILEDVKNAKYDDSKEELIDIAQSMLIYSEKVSEKDFNGVDKLSNQLYVAVIYFLIRYEAVASLLLHDYDLNDYKTESAQLIYYIVSGGNCDINEIGNGNVRKKAEHLKSYMLYGETSLKLIHDDTEKKYEKFNFDSVDDFFDTGVLRHILKKFSANNIRVTLNSVNCGTDWTDYIKFSFGQHIFSFLPSQEDAIIKGLLVFNKSFSLKMPTSAGKSYITELVIYQELRKNPYAKILYLAPLRALNRELRDRFKKIGEALKFKSKAIYGGNIVSFDQNTIDNVNVLISTPESFKGMENDLDDQLSKFSLVICDEGQLLEDPERGVDYELLLTRLKKIENVRFLFLSAIISNVKDINTWLGGTEQEIGDSSYRPCPIKFAYIQKGYDLAVKDENYDKTKYIISDFLSKDESFGIGKTKKSLASALALKSISFGPVTLFTSNRRGKMGCESIGKEIEKIIGFGKLPAPSHASSNMPELEIIASYISYQFGVGHSLPNFIRKGFTYHHGRLPQDVREVIEQNFSSKVIPLMICTNTLAEGVNLPIQTLVLYNLNGHRKYGNYSTEALEPWEIKNIIGRAGRAGMQRFGFVIYPDQDLNNKTAYKNVISALKNNQSHNIMGCLFRVISALDRMENIHNDEKMNEILENNGYADAIDTMITRSIEANSFEEIDIQSIIKESLAYHIGNEDKRAILRRVFRLRYNTLLRKLNGNRFNIYRDSGMSINDMERVEKLINGGPITMLDITATPLSEMWIDFAINTVRQMHSFILPEFKTITDKTKRELYPDELKTLLIKWINGAQYYEIARALDCDVDSAIDLVYFLQNVFCVKISSVVRYIELLGIDTNAIADWVEMVKRGVNSYEKLMLMRSGLQDRILVNALLNGRIVNFLDFSSEPLLQNSMIANESEVINKAKMASLPKMCLRHLHEYIESNKYHSN